jgi:hypothetical protein
LQCLALIEGNNADEREYEAGQAKGMVFIRASRPEGRAGIVFGDFT